MPARSRRLGPSGAGLPKSIGACLDHESHRRRCLLVVSSMVSVSCTVGLIGAAAATTLSAAAAAKHLPSDTPSSARQLRARPSLEGALTPPLQPSPPNGEVTARPSQHRKAAATALSPTPQRIAVAAACDALGAMPRGTSTGGAPSALCALSQVLWQSAQRHLGVVSATEAPVPCTKLEHFYRWPHSGNFKGNHNKSMPSDRRRAVRSDAVRHGGALAASVGEPPVQLVYAHMFKCGGDFIKTNMWAWANDAELDPSGKPRKRWHWAKDKSFAPSSRRVVFTVVREPLERFASGFGEIMWRLRTRWHRRATNSVGQPMEPRRFLHALLGGQLDDRHNWGYEHIFSMLGPIVSFRETLGSVDVVGRLENMDATLRRLVAAAAATHAGSNWRPIGWTLPNAGAHEFTNATADSADRAAMSELLASDPAVTHALACAVYLPDFICLNYSVPPTVDCNTRFWQPLQMQRQMQRRAAATPTPEGPTGARCIADLEWEEVLAHARKIFC